METRSERQFLILGHPRSRTAWLANFLTRGDSICHHELSGRGMSAVAMAAEMSKGARFVGNSDSAAAPLAEELMGLLPGLRLVIIKRPLEEVLDSFQKVAEEKLGKLRSLLEVNQKILEGLHSQALVVDFHTLSSSETAKKVWNYCLGDSMEFPAAQFELLRTLNVQMEPQFIRGALRGGMELPGRVAPLTEKEAQLLKLVLEAHAKSALRQNISTTTVLQCAAGNGTLTNSIAAGLLTLGGAHAPLEQSCEVLMASNPVEGARLLVADGYKVPGWGNSFHRGELDPCWVEVDQWLQENRPDLYAKIQAVTDFLYSTGKPVMPNPSTYTAAAALALGVPPRCAAFLFIQGRLLEWVKLFMRGEI